MGERISKDDWFRACGEAASRIAEEVPVYYRTRTFSGIIGDIKALSPRRAQSLLARKKGLGKQYARLYLDQGIDSGRGYQACAAEALGNILGNCRPGMCGESILDVGCAVGVTAGILELEGVTGFDLFPDLLLAARLVDDLAGKKNSYLCADMTRTWPFRRAFRTVVCGLVCHHLKGQPDILTFFSSACRVLEPGGSLVVTLPSGSVASIPQALNLSRAMEEFGFTVDTRLSGMVLSTDDPRSLFWMFLFVLTKTTERIPDVFIHPGFGFPEYRTPVTREEKGERVKLSGLHVRGVRHKAFRLIGFEELSGRLDAMPLTFPNISQSISTIATTGL